MTRHAAGEVLRQVLLWGAAYLLVALLPLGVALFGDTPQGRGFWVEFGVGLGIVGFAMLGLQFVTTTRFRWIAPYFGTDAKIQFHRETGILAVIFVLAHPIVLFLADPRYLEFLNPWSNLPRALALSAATGAMILLVALPLLRLQLRLSYEWWRITHGALAFLVVFVGIVHSLQIGPLCQRARQTSALGAWRRRGAGPATSHACDQTAVDETKTFSDDGNRNPRSRSL